MNRNFLFSICGVLLTSTRLAFAMEADDFSDYAPTASPILPTSSEELQDWKRLYYVKKYPFSSPSLDMVAFSRALIEKKLTTQQVHDLLRIEADKGNSSAQEKLYYFYKKRFMHVNLLDEEAANALLETGLKQKKQWALCERTLQISGKSKAIDLSEEDLSNPEAVYNALTLLLKAKEVKDETKALDLSFRVAMKNDPVTLSIVASLLPNFEDSLRNLRALVVKMRAEQFWKTLQEETSPAKRMQGLDMAIKAAEWGSLYALNAATFYFNYGFENFSPNKDKALEFALIAAGLDDSQGMVHAGLLLQEKDPSEKKRALELFLRAADLDNSTGAYNAGCLLLDEEDPDYERALKLFLKTVESNDDFYLLAIKKVIFIYLKRSQEESDYDSVFELLYSEVEKNQNPSLMTILGILHLFVESDKWMSIEKGLFWFERAVELGDSEAKKYLSFTETALIIKETLEFIESDKFQQLLQQVDQTFLKSENQHTPQNSKYMREQLKRAGEEKRKLEQVRQNPSSVPLQEDSLQIVNQIYTGNTAKIDERTLRRLFRDPFFKGQVIVAETKSGIKVIAYNPETKQHYTASTHRNHNKKFHDTVYDPAFFKELIPIFDIFKINR